MHGANEVDASVERLPVVDAGGGVDVIGAEPEDVLVLITDGRGEQAFGSRNGIGIAPGIEAVLHVRRAELELAHPDDYRWINLDDDVPALTLGRGDLPREHLQHGDAYQ